MQCASGEGGKDKTLRVKQLQTQHAQGHPNSEAGLLKVDAPGASRQGGEGGVKRGSSGLPSLVWWNMRFTQRNHEVTGHILKTPPQPPCSPLP